jgi:Tol biopolymer transport system component
MGGCWPRATIEAPSFRQLTFRRGEITEGRFTPDGQSIVYSAGWDGQPQRPFTMRIDSGESQPLPVPEGIILSVSRGGELALLTKISPSGAGTLARVPIGGGGVREVLDSVTLADWSPDGRTLAIVRHNATDETLEYPAGTVLYRWARLLTQLGPEALRISPDGALIAATESDNRGGGWLTLVDRSGKATRMTRRWSGVAPGLAWSPSSDEVWFNASDVGSNFGIHAVSRAGREHVVQQSTGSLYITDLAADGRALVADHRLRAGVIGRAPGESHERDLSWFDFSRPRALTGDGRTVAIDESGAGAGPVPTAFVRDTDGSPAVKIAEGNAIAFSPDAKSLLVIAPDRREFRIVPIGPGEPRLWSPGAVQFLNRTATWTPDGSRIVFSGSELGRPGRLFAGPVSAGSPVPVSPEGTHPATTTLDGDTRVVAWAPVVSPDSRSVIGVEDSRGWRFPLDGGTALPLQGYLPGDIPLQWSGDGRFVWVLGQEPSTARIFRIEIGTGARSLWRELPDADPAGLDRSWLRVLLSRDGNSYVDGYKRTLSDLHLGERLR